VTASVVVVGDSAERALVTAGARAGGSPVGSAAEWRSDRADDAAPRLLVALGDAAVSVGDGTEVVRWRAGAPAQPARPGERVIAQGGAGLWRRAPWPVGDDWFATPPPPRVPHFLVLGADAHRREGATRVLSERRLSAEALERFDPARLAAASAVICLSAPGSPIPAWVMAPLAARRVLILAGRRPDFGLQGGVDHLAAVDDEEALNLAAAFAGRPDVFGELAFFARRAAEAHRASAVLERLLFDLALERAQRDPAAYAA
jgi:hypothetical protein